MRSPVRILLVATPDDADRVADRLETEDDRFDVWGTTDADDAIDRLASDAVDCVVSTYRLPGTDGLALLREVRAVDADLPFVLFTAQGSERVANEAISADVSEYVRRDATGDQYGLLADRIRRAVASHRTRRDRRRSEILFEKTQDIASVGAWEYDLRTGDGFWTSGMYDIYDQPEGFVPSPEREWNCYHPDDRATAREAFERAISAGEPYDVELRLGTGDDERWVRVRGDPDAVGGEVVAVRGTTQEITERKDRERALEESRERYRSLFENNPLVIWEEDFSESMAYLESLEAEVDDLETYLRNNPGEVEALLERVEVVDVNQNTLDRLGASSKEELLNNLDQVFTDQALDALVSEFLAFANGETKFRWETIARTLDGERREELLEVHVPEAYADDYSRVYISGMDITERKQQEYELQRKNERLEEFASIVSHDLRNPLQVATSRVEIAREECDCDHLESVSRAHERMETLIDDLLALAREGETVSETEPVALAETVEQCWRNVATDEATLVVESDTVVSADEGRLQQLFENLVGNAIEHSPADVTVTVGDLDRGFYVADDGPGIPESERERVFEGGYSTRADGIGFGLKIVAEIVEAHGWEISVGESESGGARFEITGVEFAPGG